MSFVPSRKSPNYISAHSIVLSTFRERVRMLVSRPDESTYSPHLLQIDLRSLAAILIWNLLFHEKGTVLDLCSLLMLHLRAIKSGPSADES